MPRETVSIITACYNGGRFLEACSKSVFEQSIKDWEWVIIDDGSTDTSRDVQGKLSKCDGRIRLFRTRGREGAAAARNIGIEAASGRYIAFLDCDDLWLPQKLEMQLTKMRAEGIAFCWSSYVLVNESGDYLRTQLCASRCTYRDLLTKRAVIGCLTAIYDREIYGRQLMPSIRMGQDYGLFLRLLRLAEQRGLIVEGLTAPLAKYRIHDAAMTKNKLFKAWYQWRLYRDIEQLSLPDSAYCFASYLLCGIRDRI